MLLSIFERNTLREAAGRTFVAEIFVLNDKRGDPGIRGHFRLLDIPGAQRHLHRFGLENTLLRMCPWI